MLKCQTRIFLFDEFYDEYEWGWVQDVYVDKYILATRKVDFSWIMSVI